MTERRLPHEPLLVHRLAIGAAVSFHRPGRDDARIWRPSTHWAVRAAERRRRRVCGDRPDQPERPTSHDHR